MKPNKLIIILIFICTISSCSVFKEYEDSGMSLSHAKAKEMYLAYNDGLNSLIKINRNKVMQANGKASDSDYLPTESAWISMERLRLYVEFLNELERKNGEEISGVHIVFARLGTEDALLYPEKSSTSESVAENSNPRRIGDYRSRNTLYFAATIRVDSILGDEIEKHKAFYIKPKDTTWKNKYIGEFKPLEFLYYPFGVKQVAGNVKVGISRTESIMSVGGEDDGTSILGNDLNNMPPKTNGDN
ncbi:MAG: hypothetical protein JKY22_03285 [Flavobacteriaceae bacterium]|nr:hypothetical protein [Flavobacteriaceae bacterium]